MKHFSGLFFVLTLLLTQGGCAVDEFGPESEPTLTVSGNSELLQKVKGISSFDVFVGDTGKIHLAVDEGSAQYYFWSEDGGESWSEAIEVAKEESNSKQGNDIQIAANQDTLLMIWKGVSDLPSWGAAQLAVSNDKGRHWQRVESPAKGDQAQNQGYFSLAANEDRFHFFWLDDREEEGNTQGMRYAYSTDGLEWSEDETVETGLCTCCWLSTVLVGNNLHALYRDEGPRDMKLITRDIKKDKWLPSVRVGAFDWDFIGCPHQGGGLTQSADGVLHSVVWTGKEGMAGLHYLFSTDQGVSWQYRQSLSGGEGQHVDIASHAGKVLVAFDSQSAQGSEVKLMMFEDRNNLALTLSIMSNGFAHPRVISSGNNFRLFWTDLDKLGKRRLKTAKIKWVN